MSEEKMKRDAWNGTKSLALIAFFDLFCNPALSEQILAEQL